jgi:zinc ribbon protein
MFCPKCATQNMEGAHFCRSCGANISLIPQALSGQLPTASSDEGLSRKERRRRHRDHPPSFSDGVQSIVMGFGFMAVAIALALFGRPIGAQVWWFWMLLPAFGMLGRGISEVVRANQLKATQQQLPYTAPRESLPANTTSELRAPVASVTEGTTRHLGAEAPTRHFDSWEDQKPS